MIEPVAKHLRAKQAPNQARGKSAGGQDTLSAVLYNGEACSSGGVIAEVQVVC